ncbi:hypothetical protein Trydic_g16395 [Trypoxylus dichotomus]
MNLKPKPLLNCISVEYIVVEICFKCGKEDNRRALIEKHDIVLLRSIFLKNYMANLMSSSAKVMVFFDETWIYSKGNKIRSWQDDTIKSVRKPESYDGKRGNLIRNWYERGRNVMEMDIEPIIIANSKESSSSEEEMDD